MACMGRQMLGFVLAMIGFFGTIIVCALPMWKITTFQGCIIWTSAVVWEGLWVSCVKATLVQMDCRTYDPLLVLPRDIRAARVLTVIAIITAAFGAALCLAGAGCTNFVKNTRVRARATFAAGVVFICAGVVVLIPICWTAHTVIREMYNPILTAGLKREPGAALYIGWFTAALLLLGGALLCCSSRPKEGPENQAPPCSSKMTRPRADVGRTNNPAQ